MSVPGQSLHGRPSGKFGHVGYASESGSKFRALAASLEAGADWWRYRGRDSSSETGASNHTLWIQRWWADRH